MVGLRPSRKRIFLHEFGADIEKVGIYKDVTDEPLVIDEALFRNKKTMKFKANKSGRGTYMRLLAETIKDPDEIRLMWGNNTAKKLCTAVTSKSLKIRTAVIV